LQLLKVALVVAGISMLTATCTVRREIPTGTTPVLPADILESFTLEGKQKQLGSMQLVDVQGQAFDRAVQVTSATGSTAESNIQILSNTVAAVKIGDVVMVRFWLRCIESMTGEGFTTFSFEQNHPEFTKNAEIRVGATSKWQEIDVPFKSVHDFPAGQARISFNTGFDRQTIEIGGIEVYNLGTTTKLESLPRTRITYKGREADAPWRKEALARIEKIRKGDLTIQVTDSAGKPVPNANVHVVLQRHEFGFGSCVTSDLLTGTTPDAEKYRQIVGSLFNEAVFENDMKWPAVYNGVPPKTDQALDWLLAHNIEVRGHNLVWSSAMWLPTQLKPFMNDKAKLRELTSKHVTDTVTHFRGKLTQWDVVNEPYKNHVLMDLLGRDVMIEWYKLAKQADPQCKLFLNEYGIVDGDAHDLDHQANFYNWIQYLKDNGAPIDGVGIQSHFGAVLTEPARILKVFDRFSEFGLPIESTEFTINVDDRKVQSDYMRDYMITAFSHPNVRGIMLWGFWEKRHWRPQSALFANDWAIRPAGKVWIDLVHHQWKTDEQVATDTTGSGVIRGFCGDYEVTVTTHSKSKTVVAHLPHDGAKLAIVLE
jgi:endo-1,4-beta-xylanase